MGFKSQYWAQMYQIVWPHALLLKKPSSPLWHFFLLEEASDNYIHCKNPTKQSWLFKGMDPSYMQQQNQHSAQQPSPMLIHHIKCPTFTYLKRLSLTVFGLTYEVGMVGWKIVGVLPEIASCWNASHTHAKGMASPTRRPIKWLYFHLG